MIAALLIFVGVLVLCGLWAIYAFHKMNKSVEESEVPVIRNEPRLPRPVRADKVVEKAHSVPRRTSSSSSHRSRSSEDNSSSSFDFGGGSSSNDSGSFGGGSSGGGGASSDW